MPRLHLAVAAALLVAVPAAAVRADDVKDQINEALKAYEKKDLATATAALEAALGLMRQAKAENWKTVMPEPLPGWKAGEI